ncbi:hypothetical protein [Rhizobium sp. A37_96]
MFSKLLDRLLDRIALNFAARVSRRSAPVNVGLHIDDEGKLRSFVDGRITEFSNHALRHRMRDIARNPAEKRR